MNNSKLFHVEHGTYKEGYKPYLIGKGLIIMIKTKTLKNDIRRGVKHLSEHSYSNLYGATRSSLEFIREAFKHDIGEALKVDFKHTKKKWYTVTISTSKGYTVQVKGLSFGYYGEGSRGSKEVLEMLGFNEKQQKRVFQPIEDYKGFKVFKKAQ